jgi:hypothetical protein
LLDNTNMNNQYRVKVDQPAARIAAIREPAEVTHAR